jgi:pilus assembly protein CpaE
MTQILVIDDDLFYHKMVARALETANYQMHFAENGTQGLELARRHRPDLIITDVMMPDITGYEVARLLRRESTFAQTPILVLTAQTGLQDKLKSFEAGADDHLTKPFEPAELAARVTALLRRAETLRASEPTVVRTETARLIVVHSLRGGTGCSSLAVNLAIGLVSLWKTPTLLVDLTMTAGQVALMLNMSLKRTWADVTRFTPEGLDPDILGSIVSKHESGVAFIAAPTYPTEADALTGALLSAALKVYREQYDYIIADLSHDFSDITLQALDVADMIIMVASPDMASIRAVAAALDTYKKLNYPTEKIKLILNATFPRHGLSKEKIESAISFPVTLTIPYTPDLFVEAINYGQPLVSSKPDEPVSGLLVDLAFFLSREAQKKSKPENPTEVWHRMYKRYQMRKK